MTIARGHAADHELERQVRAAVQAAHDAFEARDVEATVGAYASDGQVTAAPGTFRGHEEVRRSRSGPWRAGRLPSVRDTGGTVVHGRTVIWEGEISEEYDGIAYTYPIVEMRGDDGLAHRVAAKDSTSSRRKGSSAGTGCAPQSGSRMRSACTEVT
ncbi:MAG: nuclear transport factor 2 family protein [Candidatus Nanopelagicales bacterium]